MPLMATVSSNETDCETYRGVQVNNMMYVRVCACIYVTERLKKLPLQFEKKGRILVKTEAV